VLLAVLVAAVAWAADATGKWTWSQKNQNGDDVQMALELKQDGEKLTGTLTRADQKTEIKEGSVKNNEVSFVVVREFNGQEFKINYKGKLDGDTIKGNSVITVNGEERKRDWNATRAK